MSKIVTIRGVGTVPKVERVLLFGGQQGEFKKGYRLLDFQVTPTSPRGTSEIAVTVNTIELPHNNLWNWALNTQIGWAAWNIPTNTRFGQYSNVDDEVIIVEDLFLDFAGTDGDTVNWELKLEQVDINDSQAALSMVNARAQGSD